MRSRCPLQSRARTNSHAVTLLLGTRVCATNRQVRSIVRGGKGSGCPERPNKINASEARSVELENSGDNSLSIAGRLVARGTTQPATHVIASPLVSGKQPPQPSSGASDVTDISTSMKVAWADCTIVPAAKAASNKTIIILAQGLMVP